MRDKDIKKLIDIASDGEEQSVDSEEIKKDLMDKISKNSITREYSEDETVKPKYVTTVPKAKKYSSAKITAGAAAACLIIGAIGTAAYKNSYGSKQLLPFESDNISDTVQYTLSESTSDLQPGVSENEPQTFTEDFDGIVMTVTTDKTRYIFDEIMKVTASVKNNRNETVKLYVPTTTPAHQEINTKITRNGRYLCDPVTETFIDCAVNNIYIKPGEEYVQEMNYETYFTSDSEKTSERAEEGLYSGKCTILLYVDSYDTSEHSLKDYSLDFSLILGSETDPQREICENEPQIFTRDYDGILMTVKTDKRRYELDELIHVEASLKNTTDKAIRLFVPCLGDSHKQIDTIIHNSYEHLIDIDTFMQSFDQMIDVVTIEPNEEYTQSMTYETYTGNDMSSRKQAEEGLYFGKSVIILIDDSVQSLSDGNYKYCSLDFSLIIGSPSFAEPQQPQQPEVIKNDPQTFTEDFDGIVMTVKTDKSIYQSDELIHIKASVKNTTNEKIYLFASCLDLHSHAQICTSIFTNDKFYEPLIDVETFVDGFDDAMEIVTLNPNEEYTQNMVYETYVRDDTSNRTLAEAGLYSGKSTITLIPDPNDISPKDFILNTLDFSLILK